MMDFLMALLAASVIGSLIWLIITLLKPLTQKVFSQSWHYYTGLIPAFFLTGAAWVISAGIDAVIALTGTNTPAVTELSSELGAGLIYNYGGAIEKAGETAAKARLSVDMLAPFILAVWLIGALVFLGLQIAAYIRFRRGISKIGKLEAETDCKLPVLVCPGVAAPMLVGVWRPVIVLPERDYSERELRLILLHETAHWRHGDMFIKLFLLIVNALHWFNPLAYRINKEAARLCENACDESLARNMDKTERVLYGEIILRAVTYENAPALCSGMSEGENLKRRLLYMLKGKKMGKPVMILAILLACAVVVGGVWLAVPINSVAAYGMEGADAVIAPEEEGEILGSIDDQDGILIDDDVAIYVKGRKAVHMTIDGYNAWVAAGENDADVYDFAERVIYTPIGTDEQMYMRIDEYKAWAAAGENDADVYDFAVPFQD